MGQGRALVLLLHSSYIQENGLMGEWGHSCRENTGGRKRGTELML